MGTRGCEAADIANHGGQKQLIETDQSYGDLLHRIWKT